MLPKSYICPKCKTRVRCQFDLRWAGGIKKSHMCSKKTCGFRVIALKIIGRKGGAPHRHPFQRIKQIFRNGLNPITNKPWKARPFARALFERLGGPPYSVWGSRKLLAKLRKDFALARKRDERLLANARRRESSKN